MKLFITKLLNLAFRLWPRIWKTATFVKDLSNKFTGRAFLFKISPPMKSWSEKKFEYWRYVVVSAVVAPFSGPETYIFPADKEGNVDCWLELDGSQRGTMSHREVLEDLGYVVKNVPTHLGH